MGKGCDWKGSEIRRQKPGVEILGVGLPVIREPVGVQVAQPFLFLFFSQRGHERQH